MSYGYIVCNSLKKCLSPQKNKCLVELLTHFYKFLYVEKVFNMDGGFIVSVYDSDF